MFELTALEQQLHFRIHFFQHSFQNNDRCFEITGSRFDKAKMRFKDFVAFFKKVYEKQGKYKNTIRFISSLKKGTKLLTSSHDLNAST
jgi:hypothetical protein